MLFLSYPIIVRYDIIEFFLASARLITSCKLSPENEKLSGGKSGSMESQAGLFANQVITLLKAKNPTSIKPDFSAQLQNARPHMPKELFDEISAKIAKQNNFYNQ